MQPSRLGACLAAALLALCTPLLCAPLAAQDAAAPLVMEGKKTLLQRVLVRQSGPVYATPDGAPGAAVEPLAQFYVYAREGDWVQVAKGTDGTGRFWLPAASVVDWNQNIVAALEAAPGLGRALFFSDLDTAYSVVEAEAPGEEASRLRAEAEAAEANGTASDSIVALGPREAIDQRRNLHVLPILNAEEAIFENGTFVNLLEVTVARSSDKSAPQTGTGPSENLRVAVVFVVDNSMSMGPYIAETRKAMETVYQNVAQAGLQDSVSFGLVGFRDNVAAVPALEYSAKTFVTIEQGADPASFLTGISQMTEATASSTNFREDSYNGIEHALSALDWDGYDARIIVLVTDASPREADDELSQTGLSGEGLNSLIREQLGGMIAVLHLKTASGSKAGDHERAEQLYRRLATFPNLDTLYFPVEGGDPDLYRGAAEKIGALIVAQVQRSRGTAPDAATAPSDDPIARAMGAALETMQLEYLGASKGTEAPDVFDAVIADRDFERQGLKPVSIRLLLSKPQLSDLSEALRIIVDKAEGNVLDPDKFFTQVLGAAADMSRRPDTVSKRQGESLAEAVDLSDMLDGLPYKSRIMAITEEDWVRMSISEQQTVVNELHDKLERYQRYNSATDLWVNFNGETSPENLLYPMLLDDLP